MSKNKKHSEKKTFSYITFINGIIPNIIASISIFLFFSFTINSKPQQFLYTLLSAAAIYIITYPTIFLFSNRLISRKIDKNFTRWIDKEFLSQKERTELFKQMQSFPLRSGIVTYCYFLGISLLLAIIFNRFPIFNIDLITRNVSFYSSYFGAYIITVVDFNNKEKICKKYAEDMVIEGIDPDEIKKKKIFGSSIILRCLCYLIYPAFLANLLIFIIFFQGYRVTNGIAFSGEVQKIRILIAAGISLIISVGLTMLYYKQMKESMEKIRKSTTKLLTEGLETKERPRTSLGDQMEYNIYLLNNILDQYDTLLINASRISQDVLCTTDSLSVISAQVSSTSQEQNADVREILATMEDSNSLSQNIESRITQVSNDTNKTKTEVSDAFETLSLTVEHINQINESNKKLITGINTLDELVNGIDSIVTMINDIADQTKTVAFNAELESINAKEKGHNFYIIATEIRRLANNMVNSVQEIHQNIDNIKSASSSLLKKSNEGTEIIQKETSLIKDMKEQFTHILKSSDKTDTSTKEIISTVEQQTTSFNQIVITLRQISAGIERFTSSTVTISNDVQQMKDISDELSNLRNNSLNTF